MLAIFLTVSKGNFNKFLYLLHKLVVNFCGKFLKTSQASSLQNNVHHLDLNIDGIKEPMLHNKDFYSMSK